MLLERFGLWEARNERAGSFSRGMLQRLALCRALLHEPELLVLDEPFSALDEEGAALLDRELAELRPRATFVVATHDPARVEPLATARLGVRMSALRRPTSPRWRGRTCCSSCARATPCRRCCCSSSRRSSSSTSRSPPAAPTSRRRGCSGWRSSSPRCSGSTRAFVAEREQRLIDGLLLAPCDRSAIWLGEGARRARLPRRRGARRAAGVRALLLRDRRGDGRRRRARRHRDLRRRHAARRDGGRRPRPRAAAAAALPAARDPDRRRRRRRERRRRTRPLPGFLALYDVVFAIISWASFEYVVTE